MRSNASVVTPGATALPASASAPAAIAGGRSPRVGHQVDLGEVFHHQITDVFPEDDLASFAERHYASEIHLLSHFDCYLQNGKIFAFAIGVPRKRMPREMEALLVRSFDVYKEKFTGTLGNTQADASTTLPSKEQ